MWEVGPAFTDDGCREGDERRCIYCELLSATKFNLCNNDNSVLTWKQSNQIEVCVAHELFSIEVFICKYREERTISE